MAWGTSNRRSRLPKDWQHVVCPRILARDRGRCKLRFPMCIGRATQVDHILPGDDHSDRNLQAACAPCHAHKSAKEGREAQLRRKQRGKRPPERHPGLKYDD